MIEIIVKAVFWMLLYSFNAIFIWVGAVSVHEVMHLLYARKFDKNALITVRFYGVRPHIQTEWSGTKPSQDKLIIASGVVWGALPIVLMAFHFWGYLFILIPYWFGVLNDVRLLEELDK